MSGESKLVLGTVNFGMDYGYLGSMFRLEKANAFRIIEHSIVENIQYFDTAQDYGESEEILGEYVRSNQESQLNVITKFLAARCDGNPIPRSLNKLNLRRIYAALFHDFNDYLMYPNTLRKLQENQSRGEVKKIGFSLYTPRDLEQLLSSNIPFEIIQVPYSIFDQRFDPYFSELKARDVEIHVRSIFLNGLFFQEPKLLGDHFKSVKRALEKLRCISQELGVPTSWVCLHFAHQNEHIDRLVIGVRTVRELLMNVAAISLPPKVVAHNETLKGLACNDQAILHPHEWRVG